LLCSTLELYYTSKSRYCFQNLAIIRLPGNIRLGFSNKVSKYGIKNDDGNPYYDHDPKQSTRLVDVMSVVVVFMVGVFIVLMGSVLGSLMHIRSFEVDVTQFLVANLSRGLHP